VTQSSNTGASTKEGALVIERVFNAPRELVWKAWTDPEQVKKWWGPKDFTTPVPVAEIDFRVGGKSLNCMAFPDGREIWSTGVYKEIVPPERFVTTDCFSDKDGNVVHGSVYGMPEDLPMEMMLTVTFEDVGGGKTKMTLVHEGLPAGEMLGGANQGWNESFDKLDVLLAAA
jgi:uncharacterized protein YndB with AHSA1/START domain